MCATGNGLLDSAQNQRAHPKATGHRPSDDRIVHHFAATCDLHLCRVHPLQLARAERKQNQGQRPRLRHSELAEHIHILTHAKPEIIDRVMRHGVESVAAKINVREITAPKDATE